MLYVPLNISLHSVSSIFKLMAAESGILNFLKAVSIMFCVMRLISPAIRIVFSSRPISPALKHLIRKTPFFKANETAR